MKVGGVDSEKCEAIFGPLPFKRMVDGKETYMTFFAEPVWNMEEFDQLCPPPENKSGAFTKGGWKTDPEAPAYLDALAVYGRQRWSYMIIKSLAPSNIEWSEVDLKNPKTWPKVEEELKRSLSHFEFAKVLALVEEANALDSAKLEENAKSFFQMRDHQVAEEASQNIEQESSASGELASASA